MPNLQVWEAGGPDDIDPRATWAEGLAGAFVRLDCEGHRGGPFSGTINQADVGNLKISRVRAAAHGVRRRIEHARAAQADMVFVNLQVCGVGVTEQRGREWRTAPFDIAVADTLVPFGIAHREPFELICAAIPRALAPELLLRSGGAAMSRTAQGREIAKLMLGYVGLALRPEADATALALSARHFLDLLAFAASAASEEPVACRPVASVEMIREYIAHNYANPHLSVTHAARAFGASTRHVQKRLAACGVTFSQTVEAARLEASARALAGSGAARLSVADIAYANGFSDLSHFHRAFKARFDETPAAYRAARL